MLQRFNILLKTNQLSRVFVLSVLLIGLILILAFFISGNFGLLLARSTPFPVSLHSANQANYAADPADFSIPPMELQLVIDAIWDQNPNAQDLASRLTQVNDNFLARVASITPTIPAGAGDDRSASATAQVSIIPTVPETGTVAAPATAFTSTPFNQPTGAASTKTATKLASTFTAQPQESSSTPTSLPASNTPVPPTSTPLSPTNTALPPTNTAIPPTNTAPPCGQISLSGYSAGPKAAWIFINNNSTSNITINQIVLSWPPANGNLDKIFLGLSKIWDQNAPPPSINITGGWSGGSRIIPAKDSRLLSFRFDDQALGSGYSLTVTFTNGCSASGSN